MKTDTKIFSYLDRAFWVVWAILPFIVGVRLYFLFTYGSFYAEGNAGRELSILELSWPGRILACSFLGIGLIFYISLFASMHALIRQFRSGGLFVEQTLTCMKHIALVMLIWPFLKNTLLNALAYGLFRLGDAPEWELKWFGFDLSLIAAGLVILALRLAMSHAIKLHQDAQYTV